MSLSTNEDQESLSYSVVDPTLVTSTASHQHQQEQELLSSFTVPEPPISTKESSSATEAAEHESQGTPHSEKPRTLWMGDLDPWLDESAIVDLWWQILRSKVSVKLIKPKFIKPESGFTGLSHSGYCFVEFQSYEEAQSALALNGQLLPDIAMPSQKHFPNNPDNQKKYFRLNWASGATLTAPLIHTPEYSLFVGDLTASTTEAHLLSFFQKSFPNSIRTVRVMTDPVSGKSRCFGFVRFTEESERQRALREMNGAWFGGRPLRVALATPRNTALLRKSPDQKNMYSGLSPAVPQSPAMIPQEFMYMGGPQASGGPPGPMNSSYGYFPPMMGDKNEFGMNMAGHPYSDPSNTTVFVGGLRSEVSEQTLFTLFKPFGTIQQIKIPPGKNCGFLKYSTREEAEEAIQAMEGFIIGGNRVRLGWGRVSANNKKFHQQRQMAQVAQMQAAAAMSMGMDPAAAFAAARFPPGAQGPVPSSSQGFGPIPIGIPQMAPNLHGMPQFAPPDGMTPMSETGSEDTPSDTQGQPMFWPPPPDENERFYQGYPGGGVGQENMSAMFEKLSLENNALPLPHPPLPGYQQGIFVPYGGYVPPNYSFGPPNEEDKEEESEQQETEHQAAAHPDGEDQDGEENAEEHNEEHDDKKDEEEKDTQGNDH
ncbi:RRM [Clavispora lusitaniae]|nr:RRM [Clavispora lusitaniae]